MRIALGQLWQETNTNNPLPTTGADFEAFGVLRGEEIIDRLADVNEPGGFIQTLRAWPTPPELAGLVRLPAWPSGKATSETFAWIVEEFSNALDRAGQVDAVLLALHGALVAENEPDVEGAVLQLIRERLGPTVPVVATLDLHANVTARMVKHADALVLYHTAPHIDVFETGVRAARLLGRILHEGVQVHTAFQKVPVVLPAERANTQDPASISHHLVEKLRQLERQPDVLCAGLATVQPWLDIPELGSAALVSTTTERAHSLCADLADALWQHRRDYLPDLTSIADAVALARSCPEGLTVLSDSADATTSGAPGDSTHLLAELLKHEWPRPALITLVDPDLVAELRSSPPGTMWTGKLGGKRDSIHSRPLELTLTLVRSFEARFVLSGHLGRNLAIDMGLGVLLQRGNVHILVTERSGPHFAPELFRAAGLDPFLASVLVAKSPCGFRAAYAERAARIVNVRAPGCAPADFWNYPYQHLNRPTWPWDEFDWAAPR